MPLINIRLFIICLGFACGIWMQLTHNWATAALFFGLLPCASWLLLSHRYGRQALIKELYLAIAFLAFVLLGGLSYSLQQDTNRPEHYTKLAPAATGIHEIQILYALRSTNYRDRYMGKLLSTNGKNTFGRLLINIKKDGFCKPLAPGEIFLMYGKHHPISKPANPHQFDYSAYLRNKQVYGALTLSGKYVHFVTSGRNGLRIMAERWRSHLGAVLDQAALSGTSKSISKALLLGDRRDMDPALYREFADAGVVHLLAVSGLHVGLIYGLLMGLLSPLRSFRVGRKALPIIAIVGLWAYTLLTGLSPSVVRAVFMFSLVALAAIANRTGNTMNALFAAFLFLLIANPNWLFEIGFQLSFAAVFFILWLHPALVMAWNPKLRIWRKLRDLIGVSCIAQLGVLPLCLFYFHQFPGLFWLSNMLVLPIMSIVLGLGIGLLLLLNLGQSFPLLNEIYDSLLHGITQWIGWVAGQKQFLITNISYNKADVLVGYGFIISMMAWLVHRTKLRTGMMMVAGLMLLATQRFYHSQAPVQQLVVFHIQGQSALGIRSGKRFTTYVSELNEYTQGLINSYATGERLAPSMPKPLHHLLAFGDRLILIVGRGGHLPDQPVDMVLLQNDSPIALDRLIHQCKPQLIIADGSNFGRYTGLWKATCQAAGVSFHDTKTAGAFVLDRP